MDHETVFVIFENLFPELCKGITEWFPNGLNSVRIRSSILKEDMIFTWYGDERWILESVEHYLLKLKERLSNA